MDKQKRYPPEVRERAVRMVLEHMDDHGQPRVKNGPGRWPDTAPKPSETPLRYRSLGCQNSFANH